MSIGYWYDAGMRPAQEPIGLQVSATGRALSRAFDDALREAGGSLPQWLILVALKSGDHANQRDVAAAVGIEGATLTHHLARMEADGVVRRERVPDNRRTQSVSLTAKGDKLFFALRDAAMGFDRQLRRGLTVSDVER